ncbi:Hypothetical protein R9X50_00098700 [Acrodontium crateriforme]|uniref:Laccase n=1 Tax=Acrodontium crateriforme TaxID=150365 RepID=A0AAQ3R7H4_9PEZI|nr:Hypothetical protein R9X50_00098700 [Acrodontium crateriforme]
MHLLLPTLLCLSSLLSTTSSLATAPGYGVSQNTSDPLGRLKCMDSSSCTRDPVRKVVDCSFTLRNQTRNINGTPRTMQLVNGQFPGPCIQAVLGDRINVHVVNSPSTSRHSSQNVSLHWHGLPLKGSEIYDGTPLTQCPLRQNSSMTYHFPAGTAGTHMWHSHYKLSLLDGVWGPLVVHDNNDPYLADYDEERIISVTDFANETAVSQFAHWKQFESAYYYHDNPPFDHKYDPYPGGWWIPGPDNGGQGQYYNWTYGIDGALIGVIPWVGGLINGKTHNTSNPEVIQVESGKTYRFRVISPSAFYPLEFSIDGHRFDVIAADGSSLARTGPYDYLNIHGGERYDILVNATGKPNERFWIRARTQELDRPWHQVLAILSYGNAKTTPLPKLSLYKGNVTGTRYVNCFHDIGPDCIPASQLVTHPSQAVAVPEPNIDVNLHLKFIHGPLINGIRQAEPHTPPIFSNGSLTLPGVWQCSSNTTYSGCSNIFGCNCTQVVSLEYNQQVRLTLDNLWPTTPTGVTGVHPFHLHGHKFAVLGQGYNGPYSGQPLNQINPSWRDDLIIPAGGWAVLQFTADNPGAWMGHCHMEHHLNDGMSLIFSEALDRLSGLKPPSDFPYCRDWDTTSYEGTLASEPTYAANSADF